MSVDFDELADGVRYAGGNGTSDYWRGFNDGVDKMMWAVLDALPLLDTSLDEPVEHSCPSCRRSATRKRTEARRRAALDQPVVPMSPEP